MPSAADQLLSLIVANLFHGMISLVWITGMKRVIRPLPAALYAVLLQVALVAPLVLGIAHLALGVWFPENFLAVRVSRWAAALQSAGPFLNAIFFIFLAGTAAIFFFQELFPLLSIFKQSELPDTKPDSELGGVLEKVNRLYRDAGIAGKPAKQLRVAIRVKGTAPLAALHGLLSPVLVVSEGLIAKLESSELEGVIAHEVAHFHYGGNLRLVAIWLARAVQAFNPISLILFRELVEARELSCDALAARVTARPDILSQALLKFDEGPGPGPAAPPEDMITEARRELRARAIADSTRTRLDALAEEGQGMPLAPNWVSLVFALALGGLLCAIA